MSPLAQTPDTGGIATASIILNGRHSATVLGECRSELLTGSSKILRAIADDRRSRNKAPADQ
jgi:hypothetical protein